MFLARVTLFDMRIESSVNITILSNSNSQELQNYIDQRNNNLTSLNTMKV